MSHLVQIAEQQVPTETAELLRRLRSGEEIIIQGETEAFRLTRIPKPGTLAEFLDDPAVQQARAALDSSFADDLAAVADSGRREAFKSAWD
jgi:antitoxin (DNA-binding transcriptional repressor) of toxin-antitoxin stability system